jgi:AcrR family transcriptional regulator
LEKEKGGISRGKALHRAAKLSSLSIREIVKKAGFSYPAFYVHIKNDNLDFSILAKYAKAMRYSFTDEFPELSEYLMEDKGSYGKQLSYEELLHDRDKWKEKYFDAVDRYNRLVDKYNKVLEEGLGLRNN